MAFRMVIVSILLFGSVGLGVNLSGLGNLGWGGFKKMDPRPTLE